MNRIRIRLAARALRLVTGVVFAVFVCACVVDPGGAGLLLEPSLTDIDPELEIVLPGTELTLTGSGLVRQPTGTTRVIISGNQNGVQVLFAVELQPDTSSSAVLKFTPEVLNLFPLDLAPFQGSFQLEVVLSVGGVLRSSPVPVNFFLGDALWPTGQDLVGQSVYPGGQLPLTGDGFLLDGEGESFALLSGVFSDYEGGIQYLDNLPVPLLVTTRKEALFNFEPSVLGIRPGTFDGTYLLQNEHFDGQITTSLQPGALTIDYQLSRVNGVSPSALRRGQTLVVSGAGLIPTDPQSGSATLIVLDGIFRLPSGQEFDQTGPNAVILFPDDVIGNEGAQVVFRPLMDSEGDLSGLGSTPGVFTGLATPWIVYGDNYVFGASTQISFEILPARQVVYIKLLPGFDDALEEFGLLNAKPEIITRILEVVARDYAGINVEFRLERPEDYVEYTVIEVGGADPNGANLLGLDNTEGKDVGNIRFNDVIGGFNALSEAQGYHAYGGVFVRSFFQFSAAHPLSDFAMATFRFDEIFGPVVPALGGTPAGVGEVDPTIRGGVVFLASRVLANLIGNTITHEVGHSLGLANIQGRFHNEGDHPNWIMDSGSYRPFEERAEIDGQGPAEFSSNNRSYLLEVLPPDF